MKPDQKPNHLIHETSPYLLQHAYNPVDWYPWDDEALSRAMTGDKMIILSIGYSSCHWCHVMEKESFEDKEIAGYMNEHFVCIKVDREERPDIDHIYMDAVQAMGMQGGWPLNVFLTPTQNPFYGGTYFPPASWMKLLRNIVQTTKNNRDDLEISSRKVSKFLSIGISEKYELTQNSTEFDMKELIDPIKSFTSMFDHDFGGLQKAPKFPMPTLWLFLLRYGHTSGDKMINKHVHFTLREIAKGGIYDQVGGGFCRYSVDEKWHVPHFEKMLYDNGQLLALYAEAYRLNNDPIFQKVVYETIQLTENEFLDPDGGYYSALDADSEGEEGKYYVWTTAEIDAIFMDESDNVKSIYSFEENGNWESGKNIPILKTNDFSDGFLEDLDRINYRLYKYRKKKIKPGLDNKILASWNGMMLNGLVEAYLSFDEIYFIERARRNASFISNKLIKDGKLYRTIKKDNPAIPGYLEDYAFVIQGMIRLYEATFEEKWLNIARNLTNVVIDNFYDPDEHLFYYSSGNSEKLIARKKELFDNVIPSSNSVMAQNLLRSGHLLGNSRWIEMSSQMASITMDLLKREPDYMSNWGTLFLMLSNPTAEVAITGKKASEYRQEIEKYYHPNKVVCGTISESSLPLLKNRIAREDETTIYVCFNKTCKLPVKTTEEAIKLLNPQG
ncbi:thioredoxin domain-containing protein [Bacteroidota bacterium]